MPYRKQPAPATDVRLTLETLGGAKLWRSSSAGGQELLLESGKPLALLIFVALAPARQVRRDHLIDLLWADLEPDGAKHALRQTLYYLRRLLGDTVISGGTESVTVSQPIASDYQHLLASVAKGDHARTVELFAGDFLPGFAAPGGAEFERWADFERGRLRSLFTRGAEAQVHALLTSGHARDAIQLARRARDLDREQQSRWRLVIEAMVAVRDAGGAQLEADALEAHLAGDEAEAEPATRALLRVVRNQPPTGDAAESAPIMIAELVGREREFSALLNVWTAAKASRGRHVHLSGGAGLGKTRLLDDFQARLRSGRARVASVRCNMGSREVSFTVASDLAAVLSALPGARGVSPASAAILVGLNPSLSSLFSVPPDTAATAADQLRRRALALKELLAAVAEEHPLALLVDDLHWCDAPSKAVLSQLADGVQGQHVLLVTTGRPQADARLVNPQCLELEVLPLDESQVGALVTSIAALPPSPWTASFVHDLWRAAAGSPLLVLESLQLLEGTGLIARGEEGWQSPAPDELLLALRSGGALRRRIESLTPLERRLLLALAVAGTPRRLSELSDAAHAQPDECERALQSMEGRGFIGHEGATWRVAHDEIAATAAQSASEPDIRAAHAGIGRRLWYDRSNDIPSLRLAGRHLFRAGEHALVNAAFQRFVRMQRALGDSRRLTILAAEFGGSTAMVPDTRRLVRSLPIHVRLGLTSARRASAAIVFGLVAPLSLLVSALSLRSSRERAPDAELIVLEGIRGRGVHAWLLPISASDWSIDQPLTGGRSIDVPTPGVPNATRLQVPGRPKTWLFDRVLADSGVLDVFRSENGREERLTFGARDDFMQDVSPDGRFAVIATARWRDDSHYDLATLNLATGALHAVTTGEDTDGYARWSQDGSRIAFSRHNWDDDSRKLCVAYPDGSGLRCLVLPIPVYRVLGWFDDSRVIVGTHDDTPMQVAVVSVDDGSEQTILQSFTVRAALASPDGKWIACRCDRLGYPPTTWFVVPVGRDEAARPITPRDASAETYVTWRTGSPSRAVRALELVRGLGPPQAGVPHQFRASEITMSGQSVPARNVRWTSLDTLRLTIDAWRGTALPLRTGRVAIRVEMPGWLSRVDTVEVVEPEATEAMVEDWSRGIAPRWIPYGTPQPRIDSLNGRPAFLNNGDGSLGSGAIGAWSLDASSGVALETTLSVRVTRPQWQVASVAFVGASDVGSLIEEDLALGAPDFRTICGASYPTPVEGPYAADSVSVLAEASGYIRGVAPQGSRSGRPLQLRLQLFPDGRCGVALNGEPFFLGNAASRSDSVRIVISGSSFETKALVGPITLWRGVPPGVDWIAFERRPNPPPGSAAATSSSPRRSPA